MFQFVFAGVRVKSGERFVIAARESRNNDSTERNLSVAHFHFWSRIEIVL